MVTGFRILKTIIVAALLCTALPSFAELSLNADRDDIGKNDSINFELSYDGRASGEPDLSPISQYFDILDQSRSQSSATKISIVNGKKTQTSETKTVISISAMPKQSGTVTIVPISWGKQKSAPLSIKIRDTLQQHGDLGDLFVKTEIETASPWVQQQFVVTVRAYSKYRFANGNFGLNPPAKLIARSTGAPDKVYQSAINGVSYLVQERQYLLYAEQSGDYQLPAPIFEAQFASNERDPFGFSRSVVKRSRGNALDIHIKPIPANAKSPWLPAKDVQLNAYIPEGKHKVGEPITITLSTIAQGVMAEQLPDLKINLPAGIKSYPDQPQLNNQWSKGELIATRNDKIAIIPNQAGALTIPAIQIDWWDAANKQAKVASTKAIKLNIIANQSASTNLPSIQSETTPKETANQPALNMHGVNPWWRLAAVLLALGWLISILLLIGWRFFQKRKGYQKPASIDKSQLCKSLENASPKYAARQLLKWANLQFGDGVNSIGQLQQQIMQHTTSGQPNQREQALIEALRELNKELYSASPSHGWHSQALLKAVAKYRPSRAPTIMNKPALYPDN